MGFDHAQLLAWSRRCRAPLRRRRSSSTSRCHERRDGLIMGGRPGETAAALEILRPLTDQDGIAKSSRRPSDQGRWTRAEKRRGRRPRADQQDPRNGPRPGDGSSGWATGAAVSPGRRSARSRSISSEEVSRPRRCPSWGMGGIASARDGRFRRGGAACVAVGTKARDPAVGPNPTDPVARLGAWDPKWRPSPTHWGTFEVTVENTCDQYVFTSTARG